MNKLLITFLLCSLVSFPALSRELRATSGEHDVFSRVILFFDTPSEWRIGRTDLGYRLVYGGEFASVDYGDVFKYIPRTRLLDLKPSLEQNEIDFLVQCECHLDAFELRNGHLAIDIKDGAPPVNSLFENRISQPSQDRDEPARPHTSVSSQAGGLDLLRTRNDQFETLLLTSLSRAASQNRVEIAKAEVEVLNELDGSELSSQISIFDTLLEGNINDEASLELQPERCQQNRFFSFENNDEDLQDQLAAARRDLVDGALATQAKDKSHLVDTYLQMGFGAEAIGLARDLGMPEQAFAEIGIVAARLDDTTVLGNPLENSVWCDPLLNYLGRMQNERSLASLSADEQSEVVLRLKELPEHLAHLFAERIIAYADDSDEDFLSSLNNVLLGSNKDYKGRVENALETVSIAELEELRRVNNEMSDRAVLELSSRVLKSNQALSAELRLDLQAREFEHRETAEALPFQLMLLRAANQAGDNIEAFQILGELFKKDPEVARSILPPTIEALLKQPDVAIFLLALKVFLEEVPGAEVMQTSSEALVERLISEGLPSFPMGSLLQGLQGTEVEPKMELLAALAEGRNDVAFSFRTNNGLDEDIAEYLAKVREADVSALDVERILQGGAVTAIDRTLWLASQFGALKDASDVKFSSAAQLLVRELPKEAPDSMRPQADNLRQLVESAGSLRTDIDRMLDDFPIVSQTE